MGVIKQGILGGFSGKVGGVVGSSWKGIAVMKAKPLSVANPRTAAQVAQRTQFAYCVAFAQLILASIIKPLWDRFAQNQSGYNAFMSTNQSLFAAALPSPAASLVISQGKMAATAIDSVTVTNASDEAYIGWVDDSGSGYKLATDVAYGILVNATTGSVSVGEAAYTRDGGELAFTLAEAATTGDVFHAYLAFKRADGTIVSDTGYATETC